MDRPVARARLLLPALLAGLFQVVGSFGAATRQPSARPVDTFAVALLLAGPALLLLRRRFPAAALAGTSVTVLGYLGAGYPFGPVPLSFALALLSAVLHGRRRSTSVIAGLTYLGLVGVLWLRIGPPGIGLLSGVAAWLMVLLTVGELVRSRWDRLARERRSRADAAERRATEERLRIARDLHDVLAHHVSLINVQAGTALHLLDERPELAREALAAIKTSSKEVLVELRAMLGVLRRVDEQAPRSPTVGLAGLDELLQRVTSGGLQVTVHTSGVPRPLPAATDTAAFRIVQESLTNVHRHAGPATATVRVDYTPDELLVAVEDTGRGVPDGVEPPTEGNGLPGMRERATALGGRLEAGPRPGGGFLVRAELPAAVRTEHTSGRVPR